jgi:hypothetical protein
MRWMMVALVGAMAVGCSNSGNDVKGAPGATTASAAGHAPANVKPGSHEDWCVEHDVAESQCTKCNKDLIPAFKATGDWCAEHGVPESQCTTCDPKRKKVRPAKGS